MRFMNGLFRFILLAAVAFGTGVTRGYDYTHFTGQVPVSAMAKYLAACCETDTIAVLAPRTDPVKPLYLYPRRLSVAHGMGYIKSAATSHLFSITASGVLSFAHAVSITPHTLFSLSCMMTI